MNSRLLVFNSKSCIDQNLKTCTEKNIFCSVGIKQHNKPKRNILQLGVPHGGQGLCTVGVAPGSQVPWPQGCAGFRPGHHCSPAAWEGEKAEVEGRPQSLSASAVCDRHVAPVLVTVGLETGL